MLEQGVSESRPKEIRGVKKYEKAFSRLVGVYGKHFLHWSWNLCGLGEPRSFHLMSIYSYPKYSSWVSSNYTGARPFCSPIGAWAEGEGVVGWLVVARATF